MITMFDRMITRSIITPLALVAARWKGVNNFALGARLLTLSACTMCPWGMWEAARNNSAQLVIVFVLWLVGSIFLAGFAEFLGEHVYRLDAHVTYVGSRTLSHQALILSTAYRDMFLGQLWRILLTVLLVSVGVLAMKVPLTGDVAAPLFVQFVVFWFFWYTAAVERSVIEPYLYY